ncbi:MAG: F0F1 ATP synthase subunit A [Chthoniobacterales bacterium]
MATFTIIAEGASLTAKAFSSHPFLGFMTNSALVALIVMGSILFLARRATRRMELIPSQGQNMFEAVVESLYDTFEGIVGKHMAPKTFSLLASLFLYILVCNWFGLIPGVGTIGWGEAAHGHLPWNIEHMDVPWFRPTMADLNTTLGLAIVFMIFWLYWSLRENGLVGFLAHIFGMKGGFKGFMVLIMAPIFFFVGIIEVVSILFRPVSLSMRLFGNVLAGETLLVTMMTMGKLFGFPEWLSFILSITLPIPFYFLELMVGLVQALVFTLLCAVYIQLSTTHDDEH